MELRQLEVFRITVLYGSVALASVSLNISKPTTLRLIATLERSLGFKLFNRVNDHLHLTAEGRLFYQEVQRSLAGLDRFRQRVEDIRDQRPRPLLIAAVPMIALSLLPLAIADYIKTYAEARVSMEAHSSATIIDMVIDQRCDIGIPSLAVSHVAGHSEHLFTVQMVCVLPLGHRLCELETITPADLAGERFVAHSGNRESRLRIDALFLSYGVRLKTHIEAPTAVSGCAFVAAGAGFTLVDAISAWGYPGAGVVYKPFYPSIDTDFALITSLGRRHPSGESFVIHLRNFASSKIGPRISYM